MHKNHNTLPVLSPLQSSQIVEEGYYQANTDPEGLKEWISEDMTYTPRMKRNVEQYEGDQQTTPL